METVLSGMRSTGKLHLGNYFGAARNFVKMQSSYHCYFFIADYHALTTHTNPKELNESVKTVFAEYLACGIDPNKASIYVQSHLPEVAELYLLLNMFAYKGELEKTASFKEKIRRKGQTVNAGLLTYPVLMAADILIHRANKVPVGQDQVQHLEMTRNFAQRINFHYNEDIFPMPEVFNFSEAPIKVPGLDGSTKMSKSDENENSLIYISDDADTVIKKMKKAKTDTGPTEMNQTKPQEIENLFQIMQLVSSKEVYNQFNKDYNECNIRYGDFKMQIAEDINKMLDPIRLKLNELRNDDAYLTQVAKMGVDKARESANATLGSLKRAMGLNNLLA